MNQGFASDTEDKKNDRIGAPECEKVPFQQIFHEGIGSWYPALANSFYTVGQNTVERIVADPMLEDIQGMAALYLLRHYLELALKRIAFNLRRLKSKTQNLPDGQRRPVEPIHPLMQFWSEVKNDCPSKIGAGVWQAWDTKLVDECVRAFEEADHKSDRFRYGTEKRANRDKGGLPRVSWRALRLAMEQTHNVLQAMDVYLVETYFQNAEWEAEMTSW